MKPLSERLKDFPNAQFVDWLCLACVDVREVRTPADAQEEINKIRDAVTGRFASLTQRAEAAEAKLAELGASVPVYQYESAIYNEENGDTDWYWDDCDKGFYDQYDPSRRRILFTRPAPAADLAELVPSKLKEKESDYQNLRDEKRGYNACIDTILRKIEEAK